MSKKTYKDISVRIPDVLISKGKKYTTYATAQFAESAKVLFSLFIDKKKHR
ncbi:MAG: hypothetical protein ACYSTS_02390 [Planctomycetota bacterium]